MIECANLAFWQSMPRNRSGVESHSIQIEELCIVNDGINSFAAVDWHNVIALDCGSQTRWELTIEFVRNRMNREPVSDHRRYRFANLALNASVTIGDRSPQRASHKT